ncbi:EVE domain-containing protein [Sphaerospermopsis aphanizomenoides BCCUSP55]|uniref:EVE domain-containing protein n=1 Tax=Sphaerospermopsis aphanizomenoides TaxID=459663 RepID=UPI0019072E8D|nr:EVE domain-containing protein [Sphaerospermopsis aphanizomenoides]MBK1990163.1 EVE domain-containing protein [Sphaerospermopsis aphanizomenoides BCCUSP55]
MAYYLNIFSPDTYEAFSKSSRDISGFPEHQENAANRIKVGDKFICYMTKLSRWIGVLEVQSEYFSDKTPIFVTQDDPYVIRFKVKPLVWLPKEKAIPIHDNRVWDHLSFTKDFDNSKSKNWTGKLRRSLNPLNDNDGHLLEKLILAQVDGEELFEIDEDEYQKLITHRIHRLDKVVSVTVPQDTKNEIESTVHQPELRESIKIQSLLASIGSQMGMKIWLPRSDRSAILTEWKDQNNVLLEVLPLNYDETTLKTIEQIDVLWLKGRSIVRAFEVEHTTSIYSGILRMADLLALQPNMNIKLHIVAPPERRDKVFQEIRRPVFSLLDVAPLSERCTYLSYESVQELAKDNHLSYLLDSVLDKYAEEAE